MNRPATLVAVITLMGSTAGLGADSIVVCPDGGDFSDLQAAIDASANGDIIEVCAGTFEIGASINTRGKSITIVGAVDASGAPDTFIDAQGTTRAMICISGETDDTVLSNLVLQNGFTTFRGGGVYIADSSPTFLNCMIIGSSANSNGGGVYIDEGDPRFTDCLLENNSSGFYGGGAYASTGSHPTFSRCVFQGNLAANGGGIASIGAEVTIDETGFKDNVGSSDGGALHALNSVMTIDDSDFEGNLGSLGGGGALSARGTTVRITTSGFKDNQAPNGSGGALLFTGQASSGGVEIVGCVFQSNQAASLGGAIANEISGDDALLLGTTSICGNTTAGEIQDTGQVSGAFEELSGNCIQGCCIFCGLDGAGCPECPADLNLDFIVDSIDLGILIEAWGSCAGCVADINDDGVVDGFDLNIQLGEWGDCS